MRSRSLLFIELMNHFTLSILILTVTKKFYVFSKIVLTHIMMFVCNGICTLIPRMTRSYFIIVPISVENLIFYSDVCLVRFRMRSIQMLKIIMF